MKHLPLAATAAFGSVAVSAALISAPGAAARTAAPGAEPGAAAHPAAAAPRAGSGSVAPQVRVDQVGYPPTAPKTAYVMLPRAVRSVRFAVQSPRGGVYLTGRSTDDLGRWNASYGRCTSSISPPSGTREPTRSRSPARPPPSPPRSRSPGRRRCITGWY